MSQSLLNIFLFNVKFKNEGFDAEKSSLKNLIKELKRQINQDKLVYMSDKDMKGFCTKVENDPLEKYVDDIQWLSEQWNISAQPPKLNYYHLTLDDVSKIIGADIVHKEDRDSQGRSLAGLDVRVGIVDTGWYDHPYFDAHQLHSPSVAITPNLNQVSVYKMGNTEKEKEASLRKYVQRQKNANPTRDDKGHGTAMAANLYAIAPKATIKMYKSWSFIKSFEQAIEDRNDIISLSKSLSVEDIERNSKMSQELNKLFQKAKKKNIIIFMANGNDGRLPGLLKYYSEEMISVGGIYPKEDGGFEAANYAMAHGKKYDTNTKDKQVYVKKPDICGLCGNKPHGRLIVLPTYPGSNSDKDFAKHDETEPNDGWVVISGTSSATPQVAGVCALMKQLDPDLTQDQVKRMLKTSGYKVTKGKSYDGVAADGEWSRLVYAPRAIALVKEARENEKEKITEETLVSQQSVFPVARELRVSTFSKAKARRTRHTRYGANSNTGNRLLDLERSLKKK